jgi:hypothetical protein
MDDERRACRTLGQHRSTQRKVPQGRADEERLTDDIIELADKYGRYGYRMITGLLNNSGWCVNHKRPSRQICDANRLPGNGRTDLATRRAENPAKAEERTIDAPLVRAQWRADGFG